jgi:SAM-dependent methyltransferase
VDLKESDILGEDIGEHWYYRAKAGAVRRSIADIDPTEILDIGAGSGFFTEDLLRHTAVRRATCVDTGYAADRDETRAGKPVAFRRSVKCSDADLVLLMDVLEHVDEDRAFLRDYADRTAPGAYFLISVPAFPFLWSGHDVFLEHRRRYTIGSLLPVIRAAGLEPLGRHYYYAAVFPLAAALSTVCAMEWPLMRYNRFFGLSLFALCRKP